jgi:hypothetical protein
MDKIGLQQSPASFAQSVNGRAGEFHGPNYTDRTA